MRSLYSWYVLLLILLIAGPYALGVRPRRRADWVGLTVTIAFLTWLLCGFAFLHSR